MPVILRVERDMFVFAPAVDYMVNPTNLTGVAGKGLALEFKTRVPDFFQPYREACKSGELRVGTVNIFENTGFHWGIINFPTKRYYADTSDKEDIIRGLEALRDLLKTEKYRYASIGMPMLGCGCGQQDYEVVYPLMVDHLAELDATVLLSMSPDRTEMRPKTLVIVGPPSFGLTDEDKKVVDETIDKVMTAWGKDLSDYAIIVSGGTPGLETYVCGETFMKDYENTFVYKRTGQIPGVIKPNMARNGVAGHLAHNNLLCEVADDIILFKPVGHNNNRLSLMQKWLKDDKQKRFDDGHPPRKIAVFGEHEETYVDEQIKVPVTTRDGYD